MNFVPVVIVSLILFVIAVLLAIAGKLLVSYGECKITVHQEDEEKEFLVHGGDYLLANLTENDVSINSPCGGKATCGYCKVRVLSGGGQILPTEEIFMSREDRLIGMRLACQVKVKDDIEILIPDCLATVRSIVKNRMYDPKLRWRWVRADQMYSSVEAVETRKARRARLRLGSEDEARVFGIIEKYEGMRGSIVPILQEINSTYNYLSEPALRLVSKSLNTPLSEVLRIATFYSAFSLEPKGRYVVSVCLGTTCYVKGAAGIISTFEKELGIKTGETTEDMLFTLETVRCLGCCGRAPVLKVNEDVHCMMTKQEVPKLIDRYREAQDHAQIERGGSG